MAVRAFTAARRARHDGDAEPECAGGGVPRGIQGYTGVLPTRDPNLAVLAVFRCFRLKVPDFQASPAGIPNTDFRKEILERR